MKVTVVIKYSAFRKQLKDKVFEGIVVKEGDTIQDAIDTIDMPEYYLNRVTIDNYEKPMDTPLTDGITITVWPPRIGGG